MEANIETKSGKSMKMVTIFAMIGAFITICCVVGLLIQRTLVGRGEVFGSCYEVRENKVYLKYRLYEKSPEEWNPEAKELGMDADAATFKELVDGNCWMTKDSTASIEDKIWIALGKDKNNVYVGPNPVEGISPDGFEALENRSFYNVPPYYANNEHVYYFSSKNGLVELDLDRDRIELKDSAVITDGVSIYEDGKLVE